MYALKIVDLKKTYKNGLQALKGINLEIKEGDFFGLLGPNGAGKSTTINIVTSLVNKTSGKIFVFDTDIDDDFSKAKSYIGIVPQEFNCSIFEKVFDILITQAGFYGVELSTSKKRATKILKQLGLWGKRNQITKNLSGGMKRRLLIARALVHEPRLLILDEPTAGVDIELRRIMWDFLREINKKGTSIILTTHYLEEAENLCKNIAIINHGELIESTDVKTLLKQLDAETFVVDVDKKLPLHFNINGFETRKIDEHTLEVEIHKKQSINDFFAQLSSQEITAKSMRNKVNRLEELFVKLTQEEPK